MKIRTRLSILLAGAILVLAVIGGLEIRFILRTNADLRRVEASDQLVQELFHLQSISSSFAENPTERSRRQWRAVYDQISRHLDEVHHNTADAESGDIAHLGDNLALLEDLFGKLRELEAPQGLTEEADTRRVRAVLTDQIRITEQAMVADLKRAHGRVFERMRADSSQFAAVSFLFVVILASFLAYTSRLVQRVILHPITDLYHGMRHVAGGELAYRIDSDRTDELGEVARSFDDMTEQLQQQVEHTEASRALLEELVEGVPDAMFVKASSGRYLLINTTGAELIGQRPETVIGKTDRELFQAQNANNIIESDSKLIEQGVTRTMQEEVTDIHGTSRIYLATKGPLRDQNGEIVGLFGISRDISKRVQAEEEIRRLNEELEERVRRRTAELQAANEELESFAYSVSHDLRAPLRSMDGFSRILVEDYSEELPEQARHYLERVKQNAGKMDELIQHLLRLSRLGRTPIESKRVQLETLVWEVWSDFEPMRVDRRVEITVHPLPEVDADPSLLRSVYSNLLGNALKYSGQCDIAQIEVGAIEQNGTTVMYVQDNGAGFDMYYAKNLFAVFQRLHDEREFSGSGVGLATVQRIIHRHGGEIWAESEVDRGATFYFTLGEPMPNQEVSS